MFFFVGHIVGPDIITITEAIWLRWYLPVFFIIKLLFLSLLFTTSWGRYAEVTQVSLLNHTDFNSNINLYKNIFQYLQYIFYQHIL